MGTPKSLHDTVPNRQQIVVNKGGGLEMVYDVYDWHQTADCRKQWRY
jgi:uncharacterized iron-regulated protein